MATSSAATPEVALQYLIDNNIAVKRDIKWGNHYRQVIEIKGKKINIKGRCIKYDPITENLLLDHVIEVKN